MSFALYALGFVIAISAACYGAWLLHVPEQWIAVGGLLLLGLAIMGGVKNTRQRDPGTSSR